MTIIVIVVQEPHPRTGRLEKIVSHGVDEATGKMIVLPSESPEKLGAVYDSQRCEYVLPDRALP